MSEFDYKFEGLKFEPLDIHTNNDPEDRREEDIPIGYAVECRKNDPIIVVKI